jgi:hypothetical protein
MYQAEVKREDKISDHSCDCKGRNNILPRCGGRGQEVRLQLGL